MHKRERRYDFDFKSKITYCNTSDVIHNKKEVKVSILNKNKIPFNKYDSSIGI